MSPDHCRAVPLSKAYRLLNHGPTVLVSAAHDGQRNIMAAAWAMPLDFEPPKVAVVLDKATWTRQLLENAGTFVLQVPCAAQADLVQTVGNTTGSETDKFAAYGLQTFKGEHTEAPLLEGCVAWLECRLLPEPHNQQTYDLFLGEVVAAYAGRMTIGLQGALGQGRLLLIGSSLSPQERQGITQALGRHGPKLLMLGVGTPEGAPVRQTNGEYLKDADGAILVPRLDSAELKAFITSTGGRYRKARIDDLDLRGLGLFDNPRTARNDGQTLQLDSWADQGYWLLLPLLLLAACAGRRGWLFCLPLLLALPQPSQAFEFNDLWLRPDQQGQRLLEQQRPAEAARHFEDPQWKGMALYQAGDYAGAAREFARASSASAHYNRGNALARSGELEAAVDAWEQALELEPELEAAQANKDLVEQLLRRQPEQPQQPPATEDPPQGRPDLPTDSASNGQQSNSSDSSQGDAKAGAGEDTATAPEHAHNASEPPDEDTTRPPQRPVDSSLDAEQRQALEQWLRQIPDNPSELLRRKFWYEQQLHQESPR